MPLTFSCIWHFRTRAMDESHKLSESERAMTLHERFLKRKEKMRGNACMVIEASITKTRCIDEEYFLERTTSTSALSHTFTFPMPSFPTTKRRGEALSVPLSPDIAVYRRLRGHGRMMLAARPPVYIPV